MKRFLIVATITVIVVACSSRSAVSACKNKPEDLLTSKQAQSLYTVMDSLITGVHLRQCQLYVVKVAGQEDILERFTVRPNTTHFRSYT